ncbi:MAG: alpha/beta hydrolase fold [Hyphomicrobiales bacterium]|nr:alpha/beta hydrolase fold [Hyphomicrobiales bacterium]
MAFKRTSLSLAAALAMLAPAHADETIQTIDRLVSHVSTVPPIVGKPIDLFVREKVPVSIVESAEGKAPAGKVVLMVHGGYSPSTLAFDVAYRNYSWMNFLARRGFDVFAMDMTGYGKSGHPMMDDPCNLDPRQQAALVPKNLAAACAPKYPFELVSSDTETADIDRMVDFIRALRGVDKISLIGWSGGGIRTGTYVSRHPEKIEKLVIFASSNYDRKNPSQKPEVLPKPGAPMSLQNRRVGVDQRWLGTSKCAGSIETGMPEMIWNLNIDNDALGATWGTGGLRAPSRTYWGWNAEAAAKIKVPVLVMVGEQDALTASNNELFDDLGSDKKAFIGISCATHFMVWEKQSRVLHAASAEWLESTSVKGAATGRFRADEAGVIAPVAK